MPLDRPFTMPRGADPPRERLDRGFSSVPAATTPPPRAVRGARAILPDERPGADLPDAPRALAVSLREPAGESGLSPAPSSMSGGELLDAFFERTPPPRRAGELSRFSFPRFATVLFGPWTRVLEAGLGCSLQLLLDHLLVPPLSGGELFAPVAGDCGFRRTACGAKRRATWRDFSAGLAGRGSSKASAALRRFLP